MKKNLIVIGAILLAGLIGTGGFWGGGNITASQIMILGVNTPGVTSPNTTERAP